MRRAMIGWVTVMAAVAGAQARASFSRAQEAPKKITIGLVAKSQSNPVFQAAYAGAKDAARELGEKPGVEVTIDWQTPAAEDAQKQAAAVEQLAHRRARNRRFVQRCQHPDAGD